MNTLLIISEFVLLSALNLFLVPAHHEKGKGRLFFRGEYGRGKVTTQSPSKRRALRRTFASTLCSELLTG